MNSFFDMVGGWMVVVVVSLMRLAGIMDVALGYLLGLVGIGPAREVYILLGLSLAFATVVIRGLGGVTGWVVVLVFFLMLIDLQLPQLNSANWVTAHFLGAI